MAIDANAGEAVVLTDWLNQSSSVGFPLNVTVRLASPGTNDSVRAAVKLELTSIVSSWLSLLSSNRNPAPAEAVGFRKTASHPSLYQRCTSPPTSALLTT